MLQTPTMFLGFHANMCLYFLRGSNTATLDIRGRLIPTRTGSFGNLVFMDLFSFSISNLYLFVSLVKSNDIMIRWHCNVLGGMAKTIPRPSIMQKFRIPCTVDGIAPNLNSIILPSIKLCFSEFLLAKISIRAILLLCSSELVSVIGKWMVPRVHKLCMVKPFNLPIVG